MPKNKTTPSGSEGGRSGRSTAGRKPRQTEPKDPSQGFPAMLRETIESVAIAFVLAFLFRTFEAEAFVIPTGSMATTLMGRHKDLCCPKCGYQYQVNASEEVDANTGAWRGPAIEHTTCPMCRYSAYIGKGNAQDALYLSYKGDRILVDKFAYQVSDPQRWDVAVFKYPGGAQMNFIKRVVGLPNETLRIHDGDLFVRPDGQDHFTIARKPPAKILAMMRPVYDNDYALPEIIQRGWPARWQPVESRTAGAWQTSPDYRSLSTDGTGSEERWIRYHNFVPTPQQREALDRGTPLDEAPRRQLVSDFLAYNAGGTSGHSISIDADSLGMHWVGDLILECTVEVRPKAGEGAQGSSSAGGVALELVEGGRRFHCTFDLGTGQATLSIDGVPGYAPHAATAVRGPGTYDLRFSNLDDELLLWVNGRVVKFDAPTTYEPLGNTRPQRLDLTPAAIGSSGASLEVRHLRLWRDLYYIAAQYGIPRAISDYYTGLSSYSDVQQLLTDERRWKVFDERGTSDYPLKADEFLVLGDNSPKSKDSRLWPCEHIEYYVRRELLIGKALYIYWPHSWGNWEPPIPGWPNFARMKFIR